MGKFFKTADLNIRPKNYKKLKRYRESPRAFLRVGRAGGPEQGHFYKEVIRGKYDSELSKGDSVYV